MSLIIKQAYLETRLRKVFDNGVSEFKITCGFCGKLLHGKINVSKKNYAIELCIENGEFHHKDGDKTNHVADNLLLLCLVCHKRFHGWGVIQRWLKKMGKTVDDLPDCSSLAAMNW